ncbi:MAG: response regulator [Vicinamibacteraceae bacterium]
MPVRSAAILVVDDNEPTRYSTSRVLRNEGFTVMEAGTGQEALQLATAHPPDLVVLDVNLPDIDGFEVCRQLRASPRTVRTPVIHLSATFVNDVDKVQGLDAGADGYITHPVEPPVLIATVNAFLRARRAEDALRESEAKFKAVFEHALDGISLLSHEMIFLEANPAACATFGRDRSQVVGKHISAFSAAAYDGKIGEVTAALAATGAWRGTMPVLHANGRQIELEWSVSIHSGPGIRLAITSDVTERKEIEAERERLLASERAARTDAERANQVKDDFLAALSHELRTPLNAIVGWSQLLKPRLAGAERDVVAGIEAIERNARIQAQLIADLLDVSRVASGKLQIDRQWFDPAAAVRSAVDTVAVAARGRNIEIVVAIDGEREPLLWDPSRFQQVVWNLLDNAVKFSPDGGRVDVRLTESAAHLELAVSDHGKGISPEFLPHVFEPFRQEDGGTKRGYGGLGLGLAIVRQLVEAHDGQIAVTSAGDHQGTTFTVRLHRQGRQPNQAAAAPSAPQAEGPSLAGVRLLVVEDDDDARVLIRRVLEGAGAEVFAASDVASALAGLDAVRPSLLISDIAIPGEDGYDLIHQVRTRGFDADTLPAIAVTAFARSEDRNRALAAGYQAHLSKPVAPAQLLTVVTTLLRRARRRAART